MPVNDTRVTACYSGCGKTVEYKTHQRVSCEECRAANKKRWRASHYERNREKGRADALAYYNANKDRMMASAREWKRANRDKVREQKRRYLRNTPGEILNNRMRAAIHQRVRIGKGGRSWREVVGYGPEELMAHLERQFVKGMSWDNVGEWHIDHIVPLASFKFESVDDPEFRRAWALPNLRPLWAAENKSKYAKRTHLI